MKTAALVLLCLLAARQPALASGDGFELPWTIDPYGGSKADQDAFYNGNVGVLMRGNPFSRLFAGWRMLRRLPVGDAAGVDLAKPCCDVSSDTDQAARQWVQARKQVPGGVDVDFIPTYRTVGVNFAQVQTCFPDAFRTAVATLSARLKAHGADQPDAVKAWRDGQDVVFTNCSATDDQADKLPVDFALLPDGAPVWLQQDRAYQSAARLLYRRQFEAAKTAFEAIAADPASPWSKLAPYLALRALRGTLEPASDPAAVAKVQDALQAELRKPDPSQRPALEAMQHALALLTNTDSARAALITELTGPALRSNAASEFKDSRLLGQPADNPYLDWLTVMGRAPDQDGTPDTSHYNVETVFASDADAAAHARERWAATHDTAWLLALLQNAKPGPDATDLLQAASALPTDDPAFLTAAYHRIRLTLAGSPAASRAELDTILARPSLSVTSRNLFQAERSMVSTDLADFAGRAMREPPCRQDYDYSAEKPPGCNATFYGVSGLPDLKSGARLGTEAESIINRLSLAQRTQLLGMPLPSPVRLDLALTTWTRAVLIGDHGAALRLVPALKDLLPQMAPEWAAYAAAKPGLDQRFAAWFILAKVPGASVDMGSSYTRPAGVVAEFDGSWPDWAYVQTASATPVAPPAVTDDQVCFGYCGAGPFAFRLPDFASAAASVVAAERGRFAPADPKTAGHVWEDVLDYARTHPSDARSPEALYWLVRVSRYGKSHNRSGFRAFTLLHSRYATSAWTKKTPYFFD